VLALGEGSDIIKGFAIGQDKFGLAEGLALDQISFKQGGGSTVIWFANEVLARVKDLSAGLSSDDFVTFDTIEAA
jgi:hypothetical protein